MGERARLPPKAAADACGQSRIWDGVRWPDDVARGADLGRSVGESTWDRAQQYLLGTASPPTAALTSLHRPLWFPRSDSSGGGAKYSESGGLAIGLPPGATGGWRSVALDPMPVGAYELRLNVDVSGDRPISLRVAIETSDAPSAVPLAARQLVVWPADRHAVVTLPWTSDGAQSFAFSVTAGVDSGSARLRIDAIDLVRVWSTVAGSPRFVEPSLAGRAEE